MDEDIIEIAIVCDVPEDHYPGGLPDMLVDAIDESGLRTVTVVCMACRFEHFRREIGRAMS